MGTCTLGYKLLRVSSKYTLDKGKKADSMLDMLLAKKRASDRKDWLESKGNMSTIEV